MERAQAERRSRHERSPRQVLGLGGIGREGGCSRTKEGDGGYMNKGGDETKQTKQTKGKGKEYYLMGRIII